MIGNKKVICVIPARLKSSRFPKKILKNLGGRPLLQNVWEAAKKVDIFDTVTFAIDSDETKKLLDSFDAKYVMTSVDCQSGTDRLVDVMKQDLFDADIWVNWQADEPFVTYDMIKTLLSSCDSDNSDVWTLKKRIRKTEDICCPNMAKVVCDQNNNAIYFSRSPIPFYRDIGSYCSQKQLFYKHIGLFAYRKETLQKIDNFSVTQVEDAEKLEQLRFLHHNLKVKVHETDQEVLGIDTPADLEKAEKILKTLR
jgi:3-deoxy-manno-octulosonate cytidylyltransferase (CMP-KDO synthetase)